MKLLKETKDNFSMDEEEIEKTNQTHYTFETNNQSITSMTISNCETNPFRTIYSVFEERLSCPRVFMIDHDAKTDKFNEVSFLDFKEMYFSPSGVKFSYNSSPENDIFVTTGDRTRIFSVGKDNTINRLGTLSNTDVKIPSCGLDWSYIAKESLCTWNIFNKCSTWNVEEKRLVSEFDYDHFIFDMKYSPESPDVYCVSSEKGLISLKDIRDDKWNNLLEYNDKGGNDVLKIAWSTYDPNKLAAVSSKGNKVIILDLRNPTENVVQLTLKDYIVSSLNWSPVNNDILLGANQVLNQGTSQEKIQGRVLLWHTVPSKNENEKPLSESPSHGDLYDICWTKTNSEWISGVFSSTLHYFHL